jgi:hypothetical protein
MEYFKSFTQDDMIELVLAAKKSVYICMPAIHNDIADAIIELSYPSSNDDEEVDIHILVDFDAQTFRQGYGDYTALVGLITRYFEIKSLKDNRISFIISDDVGYYLFIESRSLIPADKETINAVRIDPLQIVHLKRYFFNSSQTDNLELAIRNAVTQNNKIIEEAKLFTDQIAPIEELSEERISEVRIDLTRNPPINPDFKRIVDIYSNKFQYVKLKFEGSNLQHKKIELPTTALPISDAALKERLETKFNLFNPASLEESFTSLEALKKKVKDIRENFLTKVKSREESLLNKAYKSAFLEEIEILEKAIEETKSNILVSIAIQIEESKKQLIIDLTEFFVINPQAVFPNDPHLWQNNLDYIRIAAKPKAEEIVYRIRWPEAHSLVEEFRLDVQFSDITIEDLKNKQFITELLKIGLITSEDEAQIATFSKGIKLR